MYGIFAREKIWNFCLALTHADEQDIARYPHLKRLEPVTWLPYSNCCPAAHQIEVYARQTNNVFVGFPMLS